MKMVGRKQFMRHFRIQLPSTLENMRKTDKPIPSHTEIQLDEKTLGKYVGKYELTSNFMITITQKENKLYAQATGQSKIEIFAETKTKFFYKVVDAQIEFFMDDAGKVSKLVLHQTGEHEAKKIE